MTEAERLRTKAHELRVTALIGWPPLRRWRIWRSEQLFLEADAAGLRARYRGQA